MAAEHLESEPPRGLAAVEFDRVIAVDCAVDGAERWTTNAESDEALRDEIAARIERLVLELTT